jgi:hypothetical protein
MRKQIIIFTIAIFFVSNINAQTIGGQAVQLAQRIAQKMKDSLGLTIAQKDKVYEVNMQLHNLKQEARQQNINDQTALAAAIQVVEKRRDSLYEAILTQDQFILYKQKKINLVNNN